MPDWKEVISGGAGLGSGLMGAMGNNDNVSNAGNQYLNQIPGQTGQYFDPYFQAGAGQLPGLQQQYQQGMNDPGGKLNQIGGSFQQSPGFKFALEQALGSANRSAAAGGMAGSPMDMQNSMGLATDLANQDYYKWLSGATNLYGNAMQGSQGMANQGLQAGSQQANMIAQQLAQQAANAREDEAAKNKNNSSSWGNIIGGAAKVASAFL